MKTNMPVFAGLDIGSTKVSITVGVLNALVTAGSENPEAEIEIIGVGTAPNTGIRQGVVVNIEATAESISKARDEAELMSGYKIHEVWVGVSGTHIKSFDSKGMVAIKNKEVTATDVHRVSKPPKP